MDNFSESNIQASLTTKELTGQIKQKPLITQKACLTSARFFRHVPTKEKYVQKQVYFQPNFL
jgi:hypothetical protein